MKLFLNSTKTLFWIDFSIAINHAKFFATTFDDYVNNVRRKKIVIAIECCLIIEIFVMRTWLKMIETFICFIVCKINSCKINIFLMKQYEIFQNQLLQNQHFRCRNVDDTVYYDWFFVNHIECEFSIVILILNDIVFMRFRNRRWSFLFKLIFDLFLWMHWCFN